MPKVVVRNGNVEAALKIFKRKVNNAGILLEVRERGEFVKPSAKKNRARAAAKVREKRRSKDA